MYINIHRYNIYVYVVISNVAIHGSQRGETPDGVISEPWTAQRGLECKTPNQESKRVLAAGAAEVQWDIGELREPIYIHRRGWYILLDQGSRLRSRVHLLPLVSHW